MTAPSHSASLTAPPRRIHDVDALRSFALLGIFGVNITFMASAYPGNLVDHLLFSVLFGYSFVLQMESAQRAGQAFAPRMLRRILGLFLLGAAHIVLLYGGDVLTTYAVAALVLLAMHRVSDVVALRTAAGIYAFVVLSLVVSAAFIDRSAFIPSQEEALANASEQTQLLLGGPAEIVQHHLGGLDLLVVQAASLQGP